MIIEAKSAFSVSANLEAENVQSVNKQWYQSKFEWKTLYYSSMRWFLLLIKKGNWFPLE